MSVMNGPNHYPRVAANLFLESYFLLVIIFLSSTPLSAQMEDVVLRRDVYRELAQLSDYDGLPYYALNQPTATTVKGTGLLEEEWQEGVLVAPNDSTYRFTGRYNVLADEFQVQVKGRIRALYPTVVKGVEMNGKIFLPVEYVAKKNRGKGFFQVLYFGKPSLLLRREAKAKAAEIHPVLGTSLNDGTEIVLEEDYYYQRPGMPARPFKNKRKQVLELFGDHRTEMEAFLEKKGLNPRSQEDLIRLFEHYDRLQD